MAWVPVAVAAAGEILGGLFGGNGNSEEAERARAAAEEARQAAAEMKSQADALRDQVKKYERQQDELRDRLNEQMAARAEQDEKHQEQLREMRAANDAQRAQHREDMKKFRKEALTSEKRMLGDRLKELTRERKRLSRAYEMKFGELEELAVQVKLENDKMQQFGPELDDPSIKRIVLLGLTGDGKSTLANRLAGDRSEDADRGPFKTSSHTESETQAVVKVLNELHGVKISVVDTPGISDSSGRGKDRQHITNLVSYLRGCGGVNQFLVLKNSTNPRLSDVYKGMLRELDHVLGSGFWRYVTVVLTHVEGREIRKFPKHKEELCGELSKMFEVSGIDGIGIGLDDYDDVLENLVRNVVPTDKFICDRLISPLEELEGTLASMKEEVVAEKHELDLVDEKIRGTKASLADVEEKLNQLG